ncbi:MAG: hypothetical protein ACYCUI_11500 [Vulcanimicrobiaceae bacterium]
MSIALGAPRSRSDGIRPGDVLLWSGRSWLDRVVRFWTRSTWDHVGIAWPPPAGSATGVCDVAESLPGGVRIDALTGRMPCWRVDTSRLALELAHAETFVQGAIGRPYSYVNDVLAGFGLTTRVHGQYECAQFVADVLRAAGFPEADTVPATPEELADVLSRAGCPFSLVRR